MKMKYQKRYNKFNLQTNCRICLTQSVTTKLALSAPLRGEGCPEPLVYEALESLCNEKVPRTEKYPDSICIMCGQFLRIAYDLMAQYHESKKKLCEQLKELGEDITELEDPGRITGAAPVEIVVGKERFNIKDLVIVEEDEKEQNEESFDGFLKNLGNTVSASFVKKGDTQVKPNVESPKLVIEKVIEVPESEYIKKEPPVIQMSIDDVSSALEPVEYESDHYEEDYEFMDEPVNTDLVHKLTDLDDKDKELMESALNLKYKCPHCYKPMSTLTRAKMHSRICGKNNANLVCYVCNERFKLRKHLLKHIKEEHLSQTDDSSLLVEEEHRFRCRICHKSFKSNGSLFYHMSKHSGKKYNCTHCDKQFYTRAQAKNHSQTHNREQTVVMCPICGKGFHYQSGLFYHMKMHTNDRKLQCSYCSRKFYTRNSLKRHELTHTGARPYSCQYCHKRFRSLGEVRKHELLHTGKRPYQCEYCQMGFTQKHSLKLHLMTHSGSFQCSECGRTFADKEILRFHLKNKHQIEGVQFSENMCDEAQDEQEESSPEVDELQLGYDGFYITSDQYEVEEVGESSTESTNLIVKTYELRDEVLVETVENLN